MNRINVINGPNLQRLGGVNRPSTAAPAMPT